MVDYGIDVASWPDLDWNRPVTGQDAVAQAVFRCLNDAREGIDLRAYLNDSLSSSQLREIAHLAKKIIIDSDERVLDASVSAELNGVELRLDIEVELAETTFRLVLAATALTIDVLEQS